MNILIIPVGLQWRMPWQSEGLVRNYFGFGAFVVGCVLARKARFHTDSNARNEGVGNNYEDTKGG